MEMNTNTTFDNRLDFIGRNSSAIVCIYVKTLLEELSCNDKLKTEYEEWLSKRAELRHKIYEACSQSTEIQVTL
jgi:hypothetical protein